MREYKIVDMDEPELPEWERTFFFYEDPDEFYFPLPKEEYQEIALSFCQENETRSIKVKDHYYFPLQLIKKLYPGYYMHYNAAKNTWINAIHSELKMNLSQTVQVSKPVITIPIRGVVEK